MAIHQCHVQRTALPVLEVLTVDVRMKVLWILKCWKELTRLDSIIIALHWLVDVSLLSSFLPSRARSLSLDATRQKKGLWICCTDWEENLTPAPLNNSLIGIWHEEKSPMIPACLSVRILISTMSSIERVLVPPTDDSRTLLPPHLPTFNQLHQIQSLKCHLVLTALSLYCCNCQFLSTSTILADKIVHFHYDIHSWQGIARHARGIWGRFPGAHYHNILWCFSAVEMNIKKPISSLSVRL